ncbi:hypothetical protein NKG60_27210 [Mesorhizobium sp. M1428]|uniref:hypothetical protein n=1 Tax=Mesorhizobium sp. M1428 TaxID=2957102 RepID=UPI00333D71B2
MEQKRTTAPFINGMFGGLVVFAFALGFRFLISPDPDPASRATTSLSYWPLRFVSARHSFASIDARLPPPENS